MSKEKQASQALVYPSEKRPFQRFFKMPHTYVILFIMIVIAAVLTYIIPAGEFKRVDDKVSGQTVIVPDSYHHLTQTPTTLLDIPTAIVDGLNDSSDVVFFILIIGGAFQIITATGTIEAITGKVARAFQKRAKLIVPIFLTLFSIGGFTMGMSTEVMVFVPIGIAIARSLGYDALTGTAMITLGASCGFTAGLLNPFNVGVAQSIAQLPLFSGLWLRALLLVVLLIVTSLYIIRYASKVNANPSKSIIADMEKNEDKSMKDHLKELPHLQLQHYLTLLVLALGIASLIWGISTQGWYIKELSALFLSMGVISGFCARFGPSKIASEFVTGAKNIIFGALIVGIARAVLVVFEQGHIIDSVVNDLAAVVGEVPGFLQVLSMYSFQVIMNTFVTSGTGQAAITMPLMTPLADLIHVTRQTAVLAFQMGDGFTNMILPTSSALMGSLAVSGIPYQKWVKFIWPLMVMWLVIGGIFVVMANMIHY
ncbi:C4-dicarboxylate ABC transporter [Pullulanibacillus camelliae]|uniref:C4-dicarboxylate ABC transporter n=1 Tax=Pullulanibacillus camelliae TaxID=1707096 RepID=A0A8J2VJ60_9BACL|nr:TIGR00366 family protein [Pullulanibacillus camelliae]GGE31718.1 C4-dicarboxylate ABC transporter [Pullulanibacillus camelliae]